MRVTVLELRAAWGVPDDVLDDVEARLTALAPGALTLLPEASLHGYVSPELVFDPTPFAEPLDGPSAERCGALARRFSTLLVAPLVLAEGTTVSNAMVGYGPDGEVMFVYRKTHPWFPETWATPGRVPPPVIPVGDAKATIAICYDLHFLADFAADQIAGSDLLLFPSAWVEEPDHRLRRLVALARKHHLAIVNANWAPGDVVVPGQGNSCVIAPDGQVMARAPLAGRLDVEL